MSGALRASAVRRPSVNGGRNPGQYGGAKAGQFELGGGRREALSDHAVASERRLRLVGSLRLDEVPDRLPGHELDCLFRRWPGFAPPRSFE